MPLESASFKDDVLSYIFEMLYEARDIGSAVTIALGMIGKHYGVSRAYVFQNSLGTLTYEWCNNGIAPQMTHPNSAEYTKTEAYLTQYSRDGVFYCDNIDRLDAPLQALLSTRGVKSLLHLAIYDDGEVKGYVGFDECNESRLWTKEEIETLSTLAKVLGVFLLKDNIAHQLVESYNRIKSILDSLNIWAYVIDADSYELLYVNAKTLELSPGISEGNPCYESFFNGRPFPCDACPKKGLGDGTGRYTIEVFSDMFQKWVLATASRIPWSENKEAVLVCCIDISHYKSLLTEARNALEEIDPLQ